MRDLLSADLLRLCWNDEKGAPDAACATALPAAIAGALTLDALVLGLVSVEDGHVHLVPGVSPTDPLLARLTHDLARRRKPATVTRLVRRMATQQRVRMVRDRLVRDGTLRVEQHHVLGVIPITRYRVADATVEDVRRHIRWMLLDTSDAQAPDDHDVLLVTLAAPTGALDLLVDRHDRKAVRARARALAQRQDASVAAVDRAVREARDAAAAAVIAAVATATNTSASSSAS
jgi:hypothetical protein